MRPRRRAAATRAREEAHLAVVAPLDPTISVDPELLARVRSSLASGDGRLGRLVSADLLDLFAFAGAPAEVAERAEAVYEAGATRVDFGTPHGLDEREGVRLSASEVVPRPPASRSGSAVVRGDRSPCADVRPLR